MYASGLKGTRYGPYHSTLSPFPANHQNHEPDGTCHETRSNSNNYFCPMRPQSISTILSYVLAPVRIRRPENSKPNPTVKPSTPNPQWYTLNLQLNPHTSASTPHNQILSPSVHPTNLHPEPCILDHAPCVEVQVGLVSILITLISYTIFN